MKIYLIRHGQTTGDVEDRYGGDYDDHLTDKGKEEAYELANKLKDFDIQYIYTSPKICAQETAEILSQKLQVPVEIVEDLRERNYYGILTGMLKSEAASKYPEDVAKVGDYKAVIKDGENYENFRSRIENALRIICKPYYDKVAVITHGGPISTIFREILNTAEVKVDDCAYAIIEGQGNRFVFLNGEGIYFV